MKERSFIDTNILVYTDDASTPEKQKIAVNLLQSGWNSGNIIFSTQVMQEYFVATTKKLSLPVEVAQKKIELLATQEVAPIEQTDIIRAIEIHRLYKYSFWDSLIVTMALKLSCSILYSEDMQNKHKIEGLQILNPF